MIPTIGVMVAVYAIARLLQVPVEAIDSKYRWILLLIISVPAIVVIGFFAIDLIFTATKTPMPGLGNLP